MNCRKTKRKKRKPLFQEYLLKWRPTPFFLTLRGPSSAAAPYPIDEQPGPLITTNTKKNIKLETVKLDSPLMAMSIKKREQTI